MRDIPKNLPNNADPEAIPRHLVAEIVDRTAGRLNVFANDRHVDDPVILIVCDELTGAPPFDAISFSLATLWPLDPPLGFNQDPTPYYAGDR